MRDRNQWHEASPDELERLIRDDIETECSACTSELDDLTIENTSGESSVYWTDRGATSSVAETGFSVYDAREVTVESPNQVHDALASAARPPSSRIRQVSATEFYESTSQDQDEDLESPDMFEYANPGLHMEYTDTDVDLERSLDHLDLLECDNLGADALSSFRDRMEDMQRITEADLARGVDMQGIRWKRGFNARKEYRQYRLGTYDNYFNSHGKYRGPPTKTTRVSTDRSFLRFVQNEIEFKCSLVHFQLRNLLTALDKNSVYFTNTNCVKMYDPQDHSCKIVMDLSDKSVTYPFKISSLAMTDEYCCVGGFFGEYALKRLTRADQNTKEADCSDGDDDNVHVGLVTTDMTGITNHLCPQIRRTGGHQLTISSNDSCLRKMDVETLKLTQEVHLEHPLNCSATSTDKRLQIVVADHCSSWLLDADTGQILRTIEGHTDYSFACAWSSDGHTFATGSQDLTTRLYDARGSTNVPIAIYRASMGAIRSCKFSPCGRFLAVAEPADFVHIHDLHEPERVQSIEFFGEISGIDFAQDAFFIGNADKTIGGIAEYAMRRERLGLDNVLL